MKTHNAVLFLTAALALQNNPQDKSQCCSEEGEDEKLHNKGKPALVSFFQKTPEVIPKCAEECLKPLLLTLRASFVSGNNFERLVNTCDKLREVYDCMDRIKKCHPNHLFRVFTDGFKYMCVEHPAAFQDLMECMDLHAHIATEDCKQQCNAHKLIIGWFIYMGMQSTTFLRANKYGGPPRANVIFFRKITTEACTHAQTYRILQCYFLCLKTKYNARCHGIGGNLLMEVIIRPIAAIHNSILLSPFVNIIKLMMPAQCNFIMTDAGIAWQRIDPKLDRDLKEFYANRTEPLGPIPKLEDSVNKEEVDAHIEAMKDNSSKLTTNQSKKGQCELEQLTRIPQEVH